MNYTNQVDINMDLRSYDEGGDDDVMSPSRPLTTA